MPPSTGVVHEHIPWSHVLADTGTIGIICIATIILVHGAYTALRGPPLLFSAAGRDGTRATASGTEENDVSITLNLRNAACFPIVGSLMLLFLYVFFDHIQTCYIIFNAFIAGVCVEMTIRPYVSHMISISCLPKTIKVPCCGGAGGLVSTTLILSGCLAATIAVSWLLSNNWVLLDILGAGLCTFMLSAVRLPNIKIAMCMFVGLLLYDVFWVFFSSRVFATNVMVNVATKQGTNPIQAVASSLSMPLSHGLPALSIPAKVLFPSFQNGGAFAVLGLGDIVLPGFLLTHNLRFDKKMEELRRNRQRKYFVHTMTGYIVGLLIAILCSEIYAIAQPALMYLLPLTLGPTVLLGSVQGDLGDLWHGHSLRQVLPPAL
eukprot:m.143197 g.143197  ORF g.143197 m.143197 type:complete len:376 (+) comp17691_c0_seq2:137-1264(+)